MSKKRIARVFFKQADGVIHCLEHSIFHKGITEEKLIVYTETQTLKLWHLGNEKVVTSDFTLNLLKGKVLNSIVAAKTHC